MFKKFFAIIFCCFMVATTANADIDERKECIMTNKGAAWADETGSKTGSNIRADYVIYFDNKSSSIPTECETKVKSRIDTLSKQKDDIETVLLFGSADPIGGAPINATLGLARANTVNKLLNDAGINTCTSKQEENGEWTVDEDRCARISIGDSIQRSNYPNDNKFSYWRERAVFMFVIYKSDTCNSETISTLDQLTEIAKKANNNDILSQLTSASELCNNEKKDKLLLHSQREAIDAAINAAVTKFKDKLPGNLKISLLINSVINTRNAMAKNANVWKTAEGNFNGWRLASDSIAGVVLGTAGGLITSHIVKKNQIESGFNDIMCTIGGQSVASYGDEFSVGIR